jgi:predicted enzyme related to lactoylglutathione lyase
MGKRTSYAPGAFSWVDLATTDAAAAKSFYGGLFGWEMSDREGREGAVYTICHLDHDAVGGLFEMPGDMRATGVPPTWTSYVTVDAAEAAAARARELGGEVVDDARDVGDVGRVAVLRDPLGAVLAVWQPGERIGAERVNDVGCLCMNELATTDMDAALSFYERLFGWTSEMVDTGPEEPPMGLAYNDGTLNASFGAVEDGAPPHWRPYFTVESVEAALRRVRELGGSELLGPLEIFDGTTALVRDPQGALFALFEGEVDP